MLNPNEVYQRNQVTTARPEELTLMLYNGGLKFIQHAKRAIDTKDFPKAHTFIMKAQDIITELLVTLNMEYEISHSLQSLYEFMKRKLIEANMAKDAEILDEVQNMLVELKNTWAEAMKITKNS
ncbi:flagellar export chaperone FliS [Neobacillus sp. 114]|uniref:flagellar export chaperone FliS n=1 Tax=Neobacillus sp. 114 TaxID=3048535 RepID=UPI0024C2291D|nr:flagellar export chaperone FliS [Neobacillus sp. 114]